MSSSPPVPDVAGLPPAAVELLTSLNDEQSAAALSPFDESIAVIAGAGTGKTRVLTARIAYMLASDINPQTICCVTFTNRAARVMRARLEAALGERVNKVFIGTLHAWCYRSLRKYGKKVGVAPDFVIITPEDQIQILRDYCSATSHLPATSLKYVRDFFSRLKCGGRNISEKFMGQVDEKLQLAWQQYVSFCEANHYLDFDDLIQKGCDVAEYTPPYSFLLIDECQDINRSQIDICLHLSTNGKIFAVGDDDQKIYGFRGAEAVTALFAETTRICKLQTNYRSSSPILQVANAVIDENCFRAGKTLFPAVETSSPEAPVCLYYFRTAADEQQFVASSILKITAEQKLQYQDVAIIARTQHALAEMEPMLAAAGIPCAFRNTAQLLRQKGVQTIFAFLRILCHRNNAEDIIAWKIAILATPKCGKRAAEQIIANAEASGQSIAESCADHSRGKNLTATLLNLQNTIAATDEKTTPPERLLHTIKSIAETIGGEEKTVAAVCRIAENFAIYHPQITDNNALLLEFVALAPLDDFSDNAKQNTVALLTAHAAKGSEFDAVYVLRAEDGGFPHHHAEDIEEERRLLLSPALALANSSSSPLRATELCTTVNPCSPIYPDSSAHPSHKNLFAASSDLLTCRIFWV